MQNTLKVQNEFFIYLDVFICPLLLAKLMFVSGIFACYILIHDLIVISYSQRGAKLLSKILFKNKVVEN
jgi:hypothetical protein